MKKMILLISILIIIILLLGFFFVAKKTSIDISSTNKAEYDEKVMYEKGVPVQFPDFTLTNTGEKSLSGKDGATWHMVFNLFEISDGKTFKEISWSSGTGDIAPNPFEFNGKKYSIEKAISNKLGKLKQDELIINIEK